MDAAKFGKSRETISRFFDCCCGRYSSSSGGTSRWRRSRTTSIRRLTPCPQIIHRIPTVPPTGAAIPLSTPIPTRRSTSARRQINGQGTIHARSSRCSRYCRCCRRRHVRRCCSRSRPSTDSTSYCTARSELSLASSSTVRRISSRISNGAVPILGATLRSRTSPKPKSTLSTSRNRGRAIVRARTESNGGGSSGGSNDRRRKVGVIPGVGDKVDGCVGVLPEHQSTVVTFGFRIRNTSSHLAGSHVPVRCAGGDGWLPNNEFVERGAGGGDLEEGRTLESDGLVEESLARDVFGYSLIVKLNIIPINHAPHSPINSQVSASRVQPNLIRKPRSDGRMRNNVPICTRKEVPQPRRKSNQPRLRGPSIESVEVLVVDVHSIKGVLDDESGEVVGCRDGIGSCRSGDVGTPESGHHELDSLA